MTRHVPLAAGLCWLALSALAFAEADKADFIGYCLTWHKFLKTHAENEDTSLFPKTEELLDDRTIWGESHKEHGTSDPV